MTDRRFEPNNPLPPELAKLLPTPEELKTALEDLDWDVIRRKFAEKGTGIEHRILDENGEPQPASLMEWALWMEGGHRRIAYDRIEDHEVSTIFLGLDHGYLRPFWWETMVFAPAKPTDFFGRTRMLRPSLWGQRCETKAQALLMHEEGKKWLENYLQNERQNLQVRSEDQVDGGSQEPRRDPPDSNG